MKCLQLVRRRRVVLLAATVAGLGLGLGPLQLAHADGYPAKPVQLVVPFPPGGAVDIVGRTISKKLGDRLGQPIVVENKAGAGTVVGAAELARASSEPPAVLRERVTSKGGTTYAALTSMEAAGVKAKFEEALFAAQKRAEELGQEFGR